MQLTLTLPFPPVGLRPNGRTHWAKKARLSKTAREQGRRAMFVEMQKIESPAWMVAGYYLKAYHKTSRHLDDDNLIGSGKASRDGVADAAGQDDRTFKCLGVETFTDKDNPRLEMIIEIEELV